MHDTVRNHFPTATAHAFRRPFRDTANLRLSPCSVDFKPRLCTIFRSMVHKISVAMIDAVPGNSWEPGMSTHRSYATP